jgi:hypothetical protein
VGQPGAHIDRGSDARRRRNVDPPRSAAMNVIDRLYVPAHGQLVSRRSPILAV